MELFSLIPSLFIVQVFRRIRPRIQISPIEQALKKINLSMNISTITKAKDRQPWRITFPWWVLYPAYGLSFLIMGVSIFLIIIRGIEFGDLKTQQWLISIITGIFSSILLTQPLKIILLAIFFACVCRKSTDVGEENEFLDDNRLEITDHQTDEQKLKVSLLFTDNSSIFCFL